MPPRNKVTLLLPLTVCASAAARDTVSDYAIKTVLEREQSQTLLGSDIRFFFGDSRHGKPNKNFGEFRSNKKTNAFNKSDQEACEWAFLSALVSLRDRARQEGGNAVINIKSNYRDNETSSSDRFVCGAGAVMAGVALKGTVVTLKKP